MSKVASPSCRNNSMNLTSHLEAQEKARKAKLISTVFNTKFEPFVDPMSQPKNKGPRTPH